MKKVESPTSEGCAADGLLHLEKVGMRSSEARTILLQNNRGGYTVPSPRLYPFQWSWDSGFIALGLQHFDEEKAFAEIRAMFKAQWRNGMLPHMAFHRVDPSYFPGPELWGSNEVAEAPKDLSTSGITQPPVYGFVLSLMAKGFWGRNPSFETLVRDLYPKIVASHEYLYSHRDPLNESLVYIHHNWESADNSPVWDESLARINLTEGRDVSALRRDLKFADASQRPTNDNYNRYIWLVDLFRKHSYTDEAIYARCPFLIQDVLFNSMLIRSNEGLIHLASLLGEDDSRIKAWNEGAIASLNKKCWNGDNGFYYDYDLRGDKQVPIKVSGGLMPLFAGVPSLQQAAKLKDTMMTSFKANGFALCPSCAVDEPAFDPVKYWRGPVWINVNWMLYEGLKRYGFAEEATMVRDETLRLVDACGFYEYFDPRPETAAGKRGLGGASFSWTAALYLHMLHDT